MKKLMKYGMIGAMVLGAQTMVFANGVTEKLEMIKATKTTEAAISKTTPQDDMSKNEDGTVVAAKTVMAIKANQNEETVIKGEVVPVASVKATTLTAAEKEAMKVADQARVKEICEALDLKYDETTTLDEVFANLTEAQLDTLAEKGIIEVMAAATVAEPTK